MAPWHRLGLLVGLLWVASPGWSFNLEPREGQVYPYPGAGSQGREPYFGFAVALQKRPTSGPSWLVVGAPRANSSEYLSDRITEPGAVFKCNLESHECEELIVDKEGNNVGNAYSDLEYQDLKNGGWLGGSLDTQPTLQHNRQATAVCAPRWRNQYFPSTYLMNGVCYWLNSSLPNAPAHKRMPLVLNSKQTLRVNGRDMFFYSHGQVGLSVHFPDDPTEMILGAPGVFNWQGTVVRFKDKGPPITGDISKRRRRQTITSEYKMFASSFVPNPLYTPNTRDFDLLGYAVSSGRYRKQDELLYASGAPRGAESHGKVFIFSFPSEVFRSLVVVQELVGDQLGANFGASLTSADINGDGLSDLVVGAPMFSLKNLPDVGIIRVLLSTQVGQLPQMVNTGYHGARVSFSRFGTTLASLGDLNGDGYQDVAVGAPFEGSGAVYIFLGFPGGLKTPHSQRLAPEDFTPEGLRGFGMALSRGIDIDDNDYPDLAIGSFLSGHAVVVRSRPVAILVGSITANPSSITLEEKSFQMTACIQYGGHKVPRQLAVKGKVTLDPQSSRALFTDNNAFSRNFEDLLKLNDSSCKTYGVRLMDAPINPHEPIVLRMDFVPVESPRLSIISQPIADPTTISGVTSRVSIVTGCEADGDETCRTDLLLETNFLNYEHGQKLVIGDENKPVLEVSVFNVGEPAFLPNMTVEVTPPLALFLPSSHDCSFPVQGHRTSLVCRLSNPITNDAPDTVQVTIDAGQLTDASSEKLEVRVVVAGDGVEVRPLDNAFSQSLQLEAQAKLRLHGYSNEEQVRYTLDEKGNINTTKDASVLHSFTLLKDGPTPVGQVSLDISVPVRFQRGDTFVTIYPPQTNFIGQPVTCQLFGAEFAVESNEAKGDGSVVDVLKIPGIPDLPQPPETSKRSKREAETERDGASVAERAGDFNCSSGEVECARLHCRMDSWPGDTTSAEFDLKLAINLAVLAQHMPAMAGAVLKSSAQASILSINPLLAFTGDRTVSIVVVTQIQPESLMGEGVPWWIILLAVLGGLLLLGLLAYGLYKAGFFQRKDMEEMKAQQATVEPSSNYGTVNTELVGE